MTRVDTDVLAYHKITEDRIEAASGEAIAAFWDVVAKRFPEAKTGDVDPLSLFEWDGFVESAIYGWLSANLPSRDDIEGDAVDRFAAGLGHEACDYTLHATTLEIAMHLVMVSVAGGPIPACGDGDSLDTVERVGHEPNHPGALCAIPDCPRYVGRGSEEPNS